MMTVYSDRDREILRQHEVLEMLMEYKKRFGKEFVEFSCADFRGTPETPAAQFWKDKLAECLRENKPYDGTENWRKTMYWLYRGDG